MGCTHSEQLHSEEPPEHSPLYGPGRARGVPPPPRESPPVLPPPHQPPPPPGSPPRYAAELAAALADAERAHRAADDLRAQLKWQEEAFEEQLAKAHKAHATHEPPPPPPPPPLPPSTSSRARGDRPSLETLRAQFAEPAPSPIVRCSSADNDNKALRSRHSLIKLIDRSAVLVLARVRPLVPKELSRGAVECISFHGAQKLTMEHSSSVSTAAAWSALDEGGRSFTFDAVLPPSSTQAEIYTRSGKMVLRKVLDGFKCALELARAQHSTPHAALSQGRHTHLRRTFADLLDYTTDSRQNTHPPLPPVAHAAAASSPTARPARVRRTP